MSRPVVHQDDMPTLPDDQWPADDPALASFAEDLRVIAGGPAPEPRPGLVAAMARGVVWPEPPRERRKRNMLVKTLLSGLAAKVAVGVGLATASVTAAGAAGVLPDPAQHAVASVVAAATPFALPGTSGANPQVAGDTATTTSTPATSTTLGGGTGDDATGSGERKLNHGACVSTAAKDKSQDGSANHGKTVSSVARTDCGKEGTTPTSSSTTTSSSTSTTSTTSTTVGTGQRTTNSGPGSANGGRGNSGNAGSNNGNGGGNSARN